MWSRSQHDGTGSFSSLSLLNHRTFLVFRSGTFSPVACVACVATAAFISAEHRATETLQTGCDKREELLSLPPRILEL